MNFLYILQGFFCPLTPEALCAARVGWDAQESVLRAGDKPSCTPAVICTAALCLLVNVTH